MRRHYIRLSIVYERATAMAACLLRSEGSWRNRPKGASDREADRGLDLGFELARGVIDVVNADLTQQLADDFPHRPLVVDHEYAN